jgi:hypothetical protein
LKHTNVNRSTGFSPFYIVYETNPYALLDLAHVLDLKQMDAKVEDLTIHILEVHKVIVKKLQDVVAKYKASVDKKRHFV